MMLIILSKNPVYAAELVPNKLKFKQMLELCQLICSCGYCDIYKKIPQGKELQAWIKKNPGWVKTYACHLYLWCLENIEMKQKTMGDIFSIIASINDICRTTEIETAIFRYVKEYKDLTVYKNNEELLINVAIDEYKKYMIWKGVQNG